MDLIFFQIAIALYVGASIGYLVFLLRSSAERPALGFTMIGKKSGRAPAGRYPPRSCRTAARDRGPPEGVSNALTSRAAARDRGPPEEDGVPKKEARRGADPRSPGKSTPRRCTITPALPSRAPAFARAVAMGRGLDYWHPMSSGQPKALSTPKQPRP